MESSKRTSVARRAGSRAHGSEATRARMLEAALDIMIEEGMRAVRHRAVAKRAGVSLGSTTYHFKSIEEIIICAFEHWRSKALMTDSPFYRKTSALLAPYAGGVVPAADRPKIAAEIYKISLGYLRSQLSGKREDRLLELAFHHESVRYPALHQMVVRERREQQGYLAIVHHAMGSTAPEDDGLLTFAVFRQLEQSAVIESRSRLDMAQIRRVLRRHMTLCFGIDP